MSHETSIERCEHDQENPYAMINRDLIRCTALHPHTRWMLIYLLSMEKGWKISVKQMANHLKQHYGCSADKIYDWIKEACEVGYMKKVEYFDRGLKRSKFILSEKPKFKISLPRRDFPDSENPNSDFADHKKEHKESTKVDSLDKKEHIKEKASAEALRLSRYLYDRILKYFPKTKPPKFELWAIHLDKMHRIDKVSWDEIEKTIDFALEDAFWCRNIRSAETLRKQYDKLYAKMTPVQNKGTQEQKNKEFAINLKQFLLKDCGKCDMHIYPKNVFIPHKNESLYYSMSSVEFEDLLMKYYGVSRE